MDVSDFSEEAIQITADFFGIDIDDVTVESILQCLDELMIEDFF